jgi:hypothetical protein
VRLHTTGACRRWTERTAPFPAGLTDLLVTFRDRIVLGSDFANTAYQYRRRLAGLVRLDLGAAWLRARRLDNATVLLGLP